ncbi:MAG: sulfite exporter TauE/SafE family protein [Planctomycetota bacterium]
MIDTTVEGVIVVGIGLAAGIVGGLAGIGGSLIMLPALALLLGYDDPKHSAQHVFVAAAMMVNVLVAGPSVRQHAKKGAISWALVRPMLIAASAAIVLGVLLSSQIDGKILKQALAVFIAVHSGYNLLVAARGPVETDTFEHVPPGWMLTLIGTVMGLIGGVLGIAGGAVAVPVLQLVARVPIKRAIAASATVILVTASVGSIVKLWTLPGLGRSVSEALVLAALLGPPAIIGATIGAKLVHTLPTRWIRGIVALVLLAASCRMGGLI